MIRINLAPPIELENKLWFVPELGLILLSFFVTWFAVGLCLSYVEGQIEQMNVDSEQFRTDTKRLLPDVKKYESTTRQIEQVKDKIKAIEKITVAKTVRYLPVILLENLQKIRPEGLWLNKLTQNSQESSLEMTGGAFDNLIVAEFMAALEATKKQEIQARDLRSLIFFPQVTLKQVASEPDPEKAMKEAGLTPASTGSSSAPTDAKRSEAPSSSKSSKTESGSSLFPELNSFPQFSLKVQYAEYSGGLDSKRR